MMLLRMDWTAYVCVAESRGAAETASSQRERAARAAAGTRKVALRKRGGMKKMKAWYAVCCCCRRPKKDRNFCKEENALTFSLQSSSLDFNSEQHSPAHDEANSLSPEQLDLMRDPEAAIPAGTGAEVRRRANALPINGGVGGNGNDARPQPPPPFPSSSTPPPPPPPPPKLPHPWLAHAKRINTWSVKTRSGQWAWLRSRWRYAESTIFYVGPVESFFPL